ncbi:hypothetical protein [Chryseobacterium binzhouense]|uniref:hypothetical protein n=1 Tax=Chryseobacterium binzhouense TaxID=2593646 RepID=UPI00289A69E2|nr:hypothetical protein [Chryseobacterium binzhouense]
MKTRILQFSDNTKVMKIIVFTIYFIINFLFLVKYGIRQNFIHPFLLTAVFAALHIILFYSDRYFNKSLKINTKTINLLIVFSGIFYLLLSHLITDPYSLKIDRWQTVEYSLDYWLHGKYIYATKNFMGNIPSYLPGQLLLMLLFYLLGNVGYMQAAAMILFGWIVKREFHSGKIRIMGIFLLFVSLSYIYEAVCKSDFISSFIIISFFILYWHQNYRTNYFQKPIILGLIVGVLCLTRSVVILPLVLFLCRPFFVSTWNEKIKFSATFFLTVAFLMSTVILPAESIDEVLAYNPLAMQGQLNSAVVLFFLFITVFLSFVLKEIRHVFLWSSIIIFAVMASHIIEQILRNTAVEFLNVTYLAAALPFSIVSYCFLLQEDKFRSNKNIRTE